MQCMDLQDHTSLLLASCAINIFRRLEKNKPSQCESTTPYCCTRNPNRVIQSKLTQSNTVVILGTQTI